ncbi:MAG: TetR/AcrR family transcriptional regulator [Actinocatenispora sp.]
MQAKKARERTRPTFTESARRAQIITAAIGAFAELGYARTSFAKIAQRAGLSSTGMISYHFAGKDDVVRACFTEIMAVTTDFMKPRIDAATGHAAKLRAYIESNVELLRAHPGHVRALVEMIGNAKDADGRPIGDTSVLTGRVGLFEAHLRAGQQAGEFTDFDPRVMAIAITGAIDALVGAHTGTDGGLDLDRCGRELADTFQRATGPTPHEPEEQA